MKQKLCTILIVLCFSPLAHAQWFLGGSSSLWFSQNEGLSFTLLPDFGYEINDKIAVGGTLGADLHLGGDFEYLIGIIEPYARYTPWHNDKIFVDLKGVIGVGIGTEYGCAELGVTPSLRFRIIDQLDLFTNLGFIGATYDSENGFGGGYKASGGNLGIGIVYRFCKNSKKTQENP